MVRTKIFKAGIQQLQEVLLLLLIAILSFTASADNLVVTPIGEFFRIEANPKQGFHHPFFLYLPSERGGTMTLLVAPNNTGTLTDLGAQVQDTLRKGFADAFIAERTKSVLGSVNLIV